MEFRVTIGVRNRGFSDPDSKTEFARYKMTSYDDAMQFAHAAERALNAVYVSVYDCLRNELNYKWVLGHVDPEEKLEVHEFLARAKRDGTG